MDMEKDRNRTASAGAAKELKKFFDIFANEHRLAILVLLKEKEKSVGQIADRLDLSFNTVSRQLLYLYDKGILQRRYDGPFVIYSISDKLSEPARLLISKLITK